MQSLVVLLAVAAVARASLLPLAQPAHHPAIVLDPHGRPLDTAEVIGARVLHLQAKALEHGYLGHAPIAPAVYAAPAWGAHSALASPFLAHSGYGHLLKKRSLGLWGSHAVATPIAHSVVVSAPAHAVSHQSRVDVHSSPAIVSHAVAAPVISHVAAPVVAHSLPAAVSHQSRVDVRTSPAVVAHSVVAAPLIHSAPLAYGLHGVHGAHSLHGY